MLLLCWLVLLLLAEVCSSAKIIGGSSTGDSHYMMIRNVMEELASRGHEVTLVISSAQKVKLSEKITHKIFQVPYEEGILESFAQTAVRANGAAMWEGLQILGEFDRVSCESLLNNTDVLNSLRGFDLLVYDSTATCYTLLAEYLGIKRVEILTMSPNSPFVAKHMVPTPVSYIPQMFLGGTTDQMTFVQRVVNLLMYMSTKFLIAALMDSNMKNIKTKYNITPERSFQEAGSEVELLIIAADFALEYPQPLLPGHIMVGQLNAQKPKPLSPEFEEFVSNSDGHGFIIVSFGSNVPYLSKEEVDLLAAAFGKLRQKVVWRLKGYIPSSLSSNIKVVKWIPQTDLLAHRDIRAFVSHVGHNSLYESVYHGVPLVAFPLYGDQFFNAKKVEHFGLGVSVDQSNFDVEQLVEKIEHVINEPRFKTEAIKISQLMKDRQRTPLETTGDWIEYVLRHGGARHLRPQVFNIPWYQYYLLDVIAFLVAIATLVVMVIRLTCKCLCRLCCKKDGSKTKKD